MLFYRKLLLPKCNILQEDERVAPIPFPHGDIMLTFGLQLVAEGRQNELIVMGEKGRAQLARDRSSYIKETIADTQKVRITFSQVWLACTSLRLASHGGTSARRRGTAQAVVVT